MSLLRHNGRTWGRTALALAAALTALAVGCGAPAGQAPAQAQPTAETVRIDIAPAEATAPPTALPAPTPTGAPAWEGPDRLRYVFLFIGDGMGMQHVQAVSEALAASGGAPLSFTQFPVQGAARTATADGSVTDSAAAVTAIATGQKTHESVLGRGADGKRAETVAEALHARGMQVGVLSTVALDQATPAGFYAHVAKRSQYDDILRMLFESGFAYFAGGGFTAELDPAPLALAGGYTLAVGEEAAAAAGDGRLVCIAGAPDGDGGMAYALDTQNGRSDLFARYLAFGIRRLSDAPHGFFLAAEGGRIDHASHYHDAGDMFAEVLDMDAAVREAVAFYEAHPHETLILVTADHETGGLTLAAGDRAGLLRQTQSCRWLDANAVPVWKENGAAFADVLPRIAEYFSFGALSDAETAYLRAAYDLTLTGDYSNAYVRKTYNGVYSPVVSAAAKLAADRAGMAFTTFGHTGANVPVYALGVGAEAFAGEYENTEIRDRLLEQIKDD